MLPNRSRKAARKYRGSVRLTASVLLALLLAACNAGQDPTVEAGPGTSTDTSAPAATAPPTGSTPPVSAPAPAERAYLTGVRVVPSPEGGGRTQVVFEFEPVVPGYRIDYVQRPVTEDGSGDEVDVRGEALLEVRMENASGARLEGERVVRTYTGPERVRPAGAGSLLTEAVAVGDFEGAVTWVLGLIQRAPTVSVNTSEEGSARLIIDLPSED